MSVAQEIYDRLQAAFSPSVLDVIDDSASHAGHSGAPEGGESHFNVRVRAAAFAGQTRIARHRAVHAAIGPDLLSRIHALALEIEAE